jgi:hypothetical protein
MPVESRSTSASRFSSLLALPSLTGKRVSALGGGLTVDLGDDYAVNFRYATAHGPVVQSANLWLRPRPSSAALMLDTDAFWQPAQPWSTFPSERTDRGFGISALWPGASVRSPGLFAAVATR